jgi:hypothetical protein
MPEIQEHLEDPDLLALPDSMVDLVDLDQQANADRMELPALLADLVSQEQREKLDLTEHLVEMELLEHLAKMALTDYLDSQDPRAKLAHPE